MLRTYSVHLETDRDSGLICVSLPTLHNVADFGEMVEGAILNLRKLARFAIDSMQKDGQTVPDSDPIEDGQLCLSFAIKERPARRQRQLAGV